MNDKVSIIIPARAEKQENVERTLESIRENITGKCEVIIGFDGPPSFPTFGLYTYPINEGKLLDLKMIHFPEVVGIKTNINTMAAMATGKYLFKCDAHCSFGPKFDETLKADMKDDWIVMPRFYVLDGNNWKWQDDRHYDYFYLSCPFTDPRGFRFKAGGHWPELTAEREKDHKYDIDNTPQIHGSGWFMTKDRFFELGGFPITDPYGHAQEPANLALKNWLMGGRVVVNKKTWYAHMHQQADKKGFVLPDREARRTYNLVANYWMKNSCPGLKYDMKWFIKKFMPMPTWPDNWEEVYDKWLADNVK